MPNFNALENEVVIIECSTVSIKSRRMARAESLTQVFFRSSAVIVHQLGEMEFRFMSNNLIIYA